MPPPASTTPSPPLPRFAIGQVRINAVDPVRAEAAILEHVQTGKGGYVCVADCRSAHEANLDGEFCRILNNSLLTVPDGKSLVLCGRFSGVKHVERTTGPDLFRALCASTEGTEMSHFFFGSSPAVLERMQRNLLERHPRLRIAGAVSPPFGTAAELAAGEIVETLRRVRPTFVWVGLGAPKQEFFIDQVVGQVDGSIFLGVGLVFDYEAGTVKRAPAWMRKIGLEWAVRLAQQPWRWGKAARRFSWMIPQLLKTYIRGKR